MKITETKIQGLLLIEGIKFSDNRGDLIKPFTLDFFEGMEFLNLNFKETWFTKSQKDVIRAMHLQVGEKACEKMVSVIHGAVKDFFLYLRSESETY